MTIATHAQYWIFVIAFRSRHFCAFVTRPPSFLQEMGGSGSPRAVCDKIREKGLSSVPLKPSDVQQLMDTLVSLACMQQGSS